MEGGAAFHPPAPGFKAGFNWIVAAVPWPLVWPRFVCPALIGFAAPARTESRTRPKAAANKMRLRIRCALIVRINLVFHCHCSFRTDVQRPDAVALVEPVLHRPATKSQHFLNTSRVCALCIADTVTGKLLCPLEDRRYVSAGYPTGARGRMPVYTAASPRVSSSSTATARSYMAFASSCELPTAVIPVLPSSPKALIM